MKWTSPFLFSGFLDGIFFFFNKNILCHKQTVNSGDPGQCIVSALFVYVPQKDNKPIHCFTKECQCGTQTQKQFLIYISQVLKVKFVEDFISKLSLHVPQKVTLKFGT